MRNSPLSITRILILPSSWAIRFAVCNVGWTTHPAYCSGEGSYPFLADVYTGVIGVYSSKQSVP